ncbi:hypothetical protein, partial [Fulvivirga aurantia]|uniref:hypothetical protein n=1 Tax=Fulvivirga aurantia TaxID=2529383 RepID=UPI00162358F2
NHYSIDVALGAMISSVFMSRFLEVEISNYTIAILGVVVWCIYTYDHLDDARRLSHKKATQRHRLHGTHFKTLSYLLVAALLVVIVLLFYIPSRTLLFGSVLVCLVGVYFVLLKLLELQFSLYKEFVIAVIYTLGVLVGPLSNYDSTLALIHYVVFFQFGCIALSNLILFSLYEEREDKSQRFASLIRAIGAGSGVRLLQLILLLQLLLYIYLLALGLHISFVLPLLLMSSLLFILNYKKPIFSKSIAYRIIGDGVFLLPSLYFLLV